MSSVNEVEVYPTKLSYLDPEIEKKLDELAKEKPEKFNAYKDLEKGDNPAIACRYFAENPVPVLFDRVKEVYKDLKPKYQEIALNAQNISYQKYNQLRGVVGKMTRDPLLYGSSTGRGLTDTLCATCNY